MDIEGKTLAIVLLSFQVDKGTYPGERSIDSSEMKVAGRYGSKISRRALSTMSIFVAVEIPSCSNTSNQTQRGRDEHRRRYVAGAPDSKCQISSLVAEQEPKE